jgi:hypothetical protein
MRMWSIYPCFKKINSSITLQSAIQKSYITFQKADEFYYWCFTNFSSMTFELPFKSITSLAFKMWM